MEHGAGTTFGKFRILRKLGHGGMGTVYEAEHQHLRKRVALKVLHDSVAQKPGGTERFLREGRAAARLSHPNVVDVWDVGVEAGALFLVMELLSGEDLAARIAREKQLAVSDAVDLLLPVCAAVAAMHERGLVHRDLKPENVFLARAQGAAVTPKVLDFGICRDDESHDPAALSTTGGLVGTPNYMAPEQVTGRRADARSDQHALAVILYECLCARRPYEGPTLLELLSNIADGRFVEPRSLRPDLPAALDDAIVRALSPAPEGRFDSVRALGDALCSFASPRGAQRWAECFDAPDASLAAAPHEPSSALTLDAAEGRLVTDVGPAPPAQTLSGSETPAPRARSRRAQPRTIAASLVALGSVIGVAWLARTQPPSPSPASTSRATSPPPATPAVEPRPSPAPSVVTTPPVLSASTPDAAVRTVALRAPRSQTARPQSALGASPTTVTTAPNTANATPATTSSRPTINGAPIVD
jgi:serine/threonine protein kinase